MKQIILDKTGFPMIWVEGLNAHVHCLPVTKIQFEYFLCDSSSMEFDEDWYRTILTLNERISPTNTNRSNYWGLFLTGIKPDEIIEFAEWCGETYEIPTIDDWKYLYQYFAQRPFQPEIFAGLSLANRQAILLKKLTSTIQDLCHGQATQAEQFMYRYGVMEWVRCTNYRSEWGGLGQPVSSFQSSLRTADMSDPEIPQNPHTNRQHYYGFRLIKRA